MDGMIAVITGASGGIGESIARKLRLAGAVPVLTGRSEEKLAALAASLDRCGGVYRMDVSSAEDVSRVMGDVLRQHGRIDVLVNNAGFGMFQTVQEMQEADFERLMDINYMGTVRCTKAVLPHMLQKGSGHIVNIASAAGKIGLPKSAGYAASKHAVVGFTHSLRHDMRGTSIGVSVVNPGPVRTPFFDIADPDGTYVKNISKWMLDPDEVADAVVRAVRNNVPEIGLPAWSAWGIKVMQLFPRWLDGIAYRMMNRK